MARFYFTYGPDGEHPFPGGWTEVEAEDRDIAVAAFCAFHPRKEGLIDCAGIYDAMQFQATKMSARGNFGKCCQELIQIMRFAQ